MSASSGLISSVSEDEGKAVKVSKISALANTILAVLKGGAGIAVNSTALIADSLHSLIDVLAAIFVWIGIKIASKPPDEIHPYGHFKAESLAELFVGATIIVTSLWIIYEAVLGLIGMRKPDFEFYAVAAALISAAVNEWLARYKIRVGIETRSTSLIAEGKHSRVDVLSSLAVVVGFFLVLLGYWWADSVVAISISVLIFQIGVSVVKNAVDVLMDRVDEELALAVERIVENVEGVESVDMIATRGTWKGRIVEVHFRVMPGMSAETISALEKEIVQNLTSSVSGVVSVIPVVRVTESPLAAIPVDENGNYTGDFDSPYYMIVDLRTGKMEKVPNPHHRAEKKKGYLIASFLADLKIGTVVCGKIGEGAKAHLRSRGINVRIIPAKTLDEVLAEVSG